MHDYDKLRDEIIESQKWRIDLLKWKLLLVAGLGSFGLQAGAASEQRAVLALIPLVCNYVDTLCYHGYLRIDKIGDFLRETENKYQEYEKRCHDHRFVFHLTEMVIVVTTAILCGITSCLGYSSLKRESPQRSGSWNPVSQTYEAGAWDSPGFLLLTSGLVGLLLAFVLRYWFLRRMRHNESPVPTWLSRLYGKAGPTDAGPTAVIKASD